MYKSTIYGTHAGNFCTIGGTTFYYIDSWSTYDVSNRPQIPGKPSNYSLVMAPYAFYKDGVWVISENPKPIGGGRCNGIGLALNILDADKTKRLKRKEFLGLYVDVYKEALYREAEGVQKELDYHLTRIE